MTVSTRYISSQYTKTGYSLADIDVVAWVLALTYCAVNIFALITL